DSEEDERLQAAAALVKIGKPAVPALCAALQDRDEDVRREAAAALVKIGKPAVPALCVALKDESRDVRQKAAAALGEIAKRDPVLALRAALPRLRQLVGSPSASGDIYRTYRTALQCIEEATASLKDLPLPAGAPAPSAENLPLPAGAPALDPSTLPIPASGDPAAAEGTAGLTPSSRRGRVMRILRQLWQRMRWT
ncbi:MAG: HEAT repeat domain-containing protein, partial [Armatimonadetes bacterium]|nr:HEAT repeat domain-containing protein [Armatimonadota bacterium]